ncbi:MAG: Nucleotide-diphospho-sugar transferase domain-containing protein [Candidatus Shapirobacteria bacterium GW2011_GWE1_38_92]|uniref:Nucleotide-diphospho-sugar transferase domain-containing protein n=3 Tax=Candidatus Shapironibacteriota TaxID=1752721 RepID=A0A0G0N2L7_9BACT|nr:MAG: Nucleotide-diphospho-sugar transferase domain-containing protein [Candidatus Shapirobacteria bacterium GW2011_GWE2_38_30]KKQ92833.1 MAG: Nucleotide-diphospho-sugar transferase domain-containing protein [Candidatus Shapirobacteria bacterium GW2011_GWE1_38_92]OGL56316.1 MAG: hypothetical protein A2367_03390 [Candidatus Shapirobacteria bacterium RIFOXYB1_FULL_38_38]
MLNTPILFLIFNRPETERLVFEKIREIKPKKLYIAADGPRNGRKDDIEKCRLAREIVEKGVDWECEVHKLFRDKNLGCKMGVSGAIDWFFENVDEGIILEDDCLPDFSFFEYCRVLLKKYKNDERVGLITGGNFYKGNVFGLTSYSFSKYPTVWGWASWKRVWKNYDVDIKNFSENNENRWLKNIFKSKVSFKNWSNVFQMVHDNKIDTWDYQLTYSCWKNDFLTIFPKVNLVKNIGFGQHSTHTSKIVKQTYGNIDFPLNGPSIIEVEKRYDDYVENYYYLGKTSWFRDVIISIKNIFYV